MGWVGTAQGTYGEKLNSNMMHEYEWRCQGALVLMSCSAESWFLSHLREHGASNLRRLRSCLGTNDPDTARAVSWWRWDERQRQASSTLATGQVELAAHDDL